GQPIGNQAHFDARHLSLSRLPQALRAGCEIIVGAGYLMFVPPSAASRYEHLPVLARHTGDLVEEHLADSHGDLPPLKAIAYRELRTALQSNQYRYLDIQGNIWALAGITFGSGLRVTRYRNGVLIERCSGENANAWLNSKRRKS